MSAYYTTKDDTYCIEDNVVDGVHYVMCQRAIVNGEEKILHNEISFSCTVKDGKADIIEGFHIGTEDFAFSKADGDDCGYYVEYYHPGLLEQFLKEVA